MEHERELADAMRRMADVAVPDPDPRREAALMRAFDGAHRQPRPARWLRYWPMAALASAAVVLIVAAVNPVRTGRQAPLLSRAAQVEPPNEFIVVPGAAALPPMESGSLVRLDLPVSVLPSLGVTPPSTRASAVTADLIVGQDGLPRAVRLVD